MQQPFGTWSSPLTAAAVAAQGLRLGAVALDGDDVYWLEGRPAEGGRQVLVRREADGTTRDVTPAPFNVRTRVHEYGGGAYVVARDEIYFCNFADQRIYRMAAGRGRAGRNAPSTTPHPLTPDGPWFYADAVVDERRRRVICVREDHSGGGEPINALVSIPIAAGTDGVEVLASGYDFYSTPRLSPDGSQLTWLSWRHPQMPWDGTELWMADVSDGGGLVNPRSVAGGDDESIYQPGWSPDGTLYFVSDRDGWWRLYRTSGPVLRDPPPDAEFGRPQWTFGSATWAFTGPSQIAAAYTQRGRWHLAAIDTNTGDWRRVPIDLEPRDWIVGRNGSVVMAVASATTADAVVRVDLASGETDMLRESSARTIDPRDVSVAEAIEFQTANGRTAHAFYYPPRNRECSAPPGERPPLIAISHGGPTTATTATLDVRVQFWTTRGFAVVDVNYGGSSGYGRPYRRRLDGQWGIVDVEDMVHAVRHLVSSGQADGERLIIRGGSAGGYTTLCALTGHPDLFAAGASYYGVSDLEVLARDTHKFEARYLDRLVGPYPEMRAVYRERSPIHAVDRLACPLILFQGLEDRVVPPNQSEMMAAAVRAKGLPVALLTFAGEQHGFRRAETIARSLEAELYFYARVFGLASSDDIEPILIENLPDGRAAEARGRAGRHHDAAGRRDRERRQRADARRRRR